MSDDVILRERLKILTVPTRFAPLRSDVMVGQVVSAGASIAVGHYLLVNPVSVLGAETEGGPGVTTVNTGVTVPVYLVGPGLPQTGDNLVCRFVDFRWVAGRSHVVPNPCKTTWPRSLFYNGSVGQSQSGFYFTNVANTLPEKTYTLTFGPRPSTVPSVLQLVYFQQPGGVRPPYYTTVPASAWWSSPIPVTLFGHPTTCYFYLWFQGCVANVMVIDSPYGTDSSGNPIAEGAGNNIRTYSVTSKTPFQMRLNPNAPVVIWGTHGGDDIVPDAQGSAGSPTPVRTGP